MADETILVVDDSPTILKLVQLVLTQAGYRVVTASGGEAGLVAAQETRPRLVLLDYLMPDVDGEDVCRAMSGSRLLAEVPVVVMSAKEDEIGERFSHLGNVTDHITKPFSPDTLLAVVGHVVGRPAPPRPLALATLKPPDDFAESRSDLSATEPALAGDLAIISIADVLSMLQDQQQTGILRLSQADLSLKVFLRAGRIDFARAQGIPDEFLLGRFMVEAGVITPQELASALAERRHKGGHAVLLGADLVAREVITAAGLRKAMALQTSALVYEGMRWGSGKFSFVPTDIQDEQAREAGLALPVDALIMEGLRRVDEWRLIEREIGDFDQVFVRNEEKLSTFGRTHLLREELAVLEFVNGRNSVREIVAATRMGSFHVCKMLFRLLRNKLARRRVMAMAV